MTYLTRANALKDKLVAVRRDLHMHPEIGFQEYRTAQKIVGILHELGIEYESGIVKTGGSVRDHSVELQRVNRRWSYIGTDPLPTDPSILLWEKTKTGRAIPVWEAAQFIQQGQPVAKVAFLLVFAVPVTALFVESLMRRLEIDATGITAFRLLGRRRRLQARDREVPAPSRRTTKRRTRARSAKEPYHQVEPTDYMEPYRQVEPYHEVELLPPTMESCHQVESSHRPRSPVIRWSPMKRGD